MLVSSVTLNFSYLVALARNYGQSGTFATGDLNGDGKVDFNDLVLLARNYGHALPQPAASALGGAMAPSISDDPLLFMLRRRRPR